MPKMGTDSIKGVPPPGKLQVVNIYVDPDTGKLVIEYEDKNPE